MATYLLYFLLASLGVYVIAGLIKDSIEEFSKVK